MKKKNNRKNNGINKRISHLSRLSSRTNIVQIDKIGEEYIIVPPIINQKSVLNPRTIKFALGDTTKEKEVEKLIKRNHIRGGKTYVTSRVLNKTNEDDGGVYPPFMPKNIKVVEVKDIKIVKIKE